MLFELARPLDDLEEPLLSDFAGQRLTLGEVFAQHSVGRPYVIRNYKDALIKQDAAGKIAADPAAAQRRAGTFAGKVIVTFPELGTAP